MQEDSVPFVPTPVLRRYETGCGGMVQTVPCMRRQEGTSAAYTSTVAALPVRLPVVDIAGPLPRTPRGNRYILVAMDYFSNWPEAYGIPHHEAETVAGVLVREFFSRFGIPGELHSDQGREFQSKVFRQC